MPIRPTPGDFLPLKTDTFYVLLVLLYGERHGYAIMREAVDLVDRGIVDADGMDRCVRWGIGYKLAVIGPMELLDMAGLDIYTSVGSYLNPDLSDEKGISKTATELIEQGRLGIKTGGGFFDYTPERIKELQQQRAA